MNSRMVVLPVLLVIVIIPLVSASSITRTLSKTMVAPGESITVSINVDLTNGESFYIIDEIIPEGFTASNPSNDGSTADKGHVKWVTIQDAKSTTLTYTLTAPQEPGTYRFSGQYGIEGSDDILDIGGQNTITVSESVSASVSPFILISAVILIVIAVAAMIFLKKKK